MLEKKRKQRVIRLIFPQMNEETLSDFLKKKLIIVEFVIFIEKSKYLNTQPQSTKFGGFFSTINQFLSQAVFLYNYKITP